jgi:carbon monoxide dehydrogenase subunit G
MKMTGECVIAATPEKVWDALNDPEILKRCIAGAEEVIKTSDTTFTAKVKAKVGPVSARFAGDVTLSDLDPPHSFTISGAGKGGAAGFAKGGAKVNLTPAEGGTLLTYEVNASVGGKLAQIGSRLIDGTAKKMAADFFGNFAKVFEAPAAAEEMAAEAASMAEADEPQLADQPAELDDSDVGAGASTGIWVTGLLIVVLLLLAFFAL